MPAASYDLLIEKGATFRFSMRLVASGEPVDLTGMQARMMFRPNYISDAIEELTCTTENGRIVLGDELGTIEVTIPAEATSAVAEKCKAVYDLELVTLPGSPEEVERLLQGRAELSEEVTKDDA